MSGAFFVSLGREGEGIIMGRERSSNGNYKTGRRRSRNAMEEKGRVNGVVWEDL